MTGVSVSFEILEMATAAELTRTVDRLEERVGNHIKFFWAVVAAGAVWMASLSARLYNIHNEIKNTNTNLQASLLNLEAREAPQTAINRLKTSDQKLFAKALPALKTVASQSPDKVQVSEQDIRKLAHKLKTTNQNAPDYWPTALQFVQFAGQQLFYPSDDEPTEQLQIEPGKAYARSKPFVNMRLHIYGARFDNQEFKRCVIDLVEGPVFFNKCKFEECLFIFHNKDNPPEYAKQIVAQLLDSNFHSATITTMG